MGVIEDRQRVTVRAFGLALVVASACLGTIAPVSAARFTRGDANVDGDVDVTDAIVTLGFQFLGDPAEFSCRDAADSDDSGSIDITDSISLLRHFFLGDPPPPPPENCGDDPTTQDRLDCAEFALCPEIDVFRTIECDFPEDGAMIQAVAGSSINFRGRISEPAGIVSVLVNGVEVAVAPTGTFQRAVEVRYGINFVEVRAEDVAGTAFTRTCTFLAAERFHSEDELLDDSIVLALRQAALDDGNRSDLDSIGDLIGGVVASDQFVDTVDQALAGANPLKDSCDIREPIFDSCIFRSRVNYAGGFDVSQADAAISPDGDGLRIVLTLRDVDIPLSIGGTISTSGRVEVSEVTASAVFEFDVVDGQLRTTIDNASVVVNVGSVSTNFSGLSGVILDVIASVANGQIRTLIANEIRDFIRSEVPRVLGDFLASLDIASLGDRFQLTTLDGERNVAIDFAVAPSRVNPEPFGLAFGLASRFSTDAAHARPSRGVALPSPTWVVRQPNRAAGIGIHAAFFNHALHALWRGGVLDGTFDSSQLGDDLPPGVEIALISRLPPVVEIRAGARIALMLGGLRLQIVIPGGFDEPLEVTVGAVLVAPASVDGDELTFGEVEIEELGFTAQFGPLSELERVALEVLLTELVSRAANDLLREAIPALPLPTFELPPSLEPFGFPAGAKLGIVAPVLRSGGAQLIVEGRFAAAGP